MASGLAQEQLQRVGRRLHGRREWGAARGGHLHDLDATLVQLAQQRFVLERCELVHLDDVRDFSRANRSRLLTALEELAQLLEREDVVDVD